MHVLKVFRWKTPQACLRFRQLQPAYGKTPASKGKGKPDALSADQACDAAEAADYAWPAQIILDCPGTTHRGDG
ncbi:hypothetical protein [Achromobacter xylosoxidans]|uniref:hypothetical protein n=1 Tax=Alcaligenes xylosoxydans xylosoxydans TaxID=85698 RepID=UPI0001F422FD|nr:hypothetical protein [Achromobacter xylosoxidans]EFV86731.1 hypothetical protein HMPREF0005_05772 [Achromobacter xylosoxidans C54]KMJ91578.1 hypothetical protein ACH58_02340 [Achromobacter xylosoxidans]MBK1980449.1 hypothetical protein [Achromobacter xylosoxidans]MCH4592624.1 hypothetical protein [Achromobacter xylosoxidans]CCH09057.1 hypothetical protein NH44784_051141 [Achromobacter xylosoxidans NH44784-1996]